MVNLKVVSMVMIEMSYHILVSLTYANYDSDIIYKQCGRCNGIKVKIRPDEE